MMLYRENTKHWLRTTKALNTEMFLSLSPEFIELLQYK